MLEILSSDRDHFHTCRLRSTGICTVTPPPSMNTRSPSTRIGFCTELSTTLKGQFDAPYHFGQDTLVEIISVVDWMTRRIGHNGKRKACNTLMNPLKHMKTVIANEHFVRIPSLNNTRTERPFWTKSSSSLRKRTANKQGDSGNTKRSTS